ncbi:M6 family metalloprotease domain-containing protein [Streptomyces sp. H10-C2]|uniref:M6 family metalloprotease domain-containing protein n=1 Tax=unclassified Streptomyces TaxID=2593676 RepID=UPI0024BA74E0|nr:MULTISPECIES: M6 family metalloprotease domain-containing protein [unclassified Streptomyces]MDJ0339991.1 M6 family metalloprotease domain-containing protein [Streptomyces sp. PH10-H1]MDJ0369372.1 M6 family metalloprotease domain-containing protein [Streptomyces sp. H10-C2]
MRARRRSLRSVVAAASVFAAVVAWTLVAGPSAAATAPGGDCALPRTAAHHSEGVDAWNAEYPRPRGALDAVMIFLSFPDAVPLLTPASVAADHFPATSRFYDRASYGQFQLRSHPVDRWFTMPRNSTDYGIRRDWDPGKRTQYLRDAIDAADAAVDFSAYDLVYLVADPDAPGVDADATKVVNLATPLRADGTDLRRLVTVFERHPPDRNVLAHETGHVFDLPDLYSRPAPGSDADWDTHVGDWDLMGSQFGLAPEPFAWHKWRFGWLEDRQVHCVSRTGTTWHVLQPLETAGGTKLVVVRTGPRTALAIEARAALGNDATLCREGVLLYEVRSGVESGDGPVDVLDGHPGTSACQKGSAYPPLADAPLSAGESYAYDAGLVRVTVAARSSDGSWAVKVSRG